MSEQNDTSGADASMQVKISPAAQKMLQMLSEKHGVTNKAFVARLIQWSTTMSPAVRNAIIYPDGDPAAELVKERMLKLGTAALTEAADSFTVEEAVLAIQALTEHVRNAHAAVARELGEQIKAKKK